MSEKKEYYKKYTGKSNSIVDALKAVGVKAPTKEYRTIVAFLNGIKSYSGSAAQNTALLDKLKAGKLIKSITVEFDYREKFIGMLQRYDSVIKKYGGLIHYSSEDAEPTFAKAKARLEKGKKTGLICVTPCRWAMKDAGINPNGFYGKDGSFKDCYKDDIKKHLKRITTGSVIGKTIEKAVKNKLLTPGDIITFKSMTHTFVYSGDRCIMYDGGHAADYPKTGIKADYTKYYSKNKISEVLRWKD